jgi:hypothetical protein
LLVNYRPEYRHQWGSKTYYTQLRLAPLRKEEAEEFLTALLGATGEAQQAAPLYALKQLILEKTEGTPFFMEEIVQTLFEDGVLARNGTVKLAKSLNAVKVPATVQAILASRIDRLPPDEKELLQQLAVIVREFLSLVRQYDAARRRVVSSPRRIAAPRVSLRTTHLPEAEYIFKLSPDAGSGLLLRALLERRKALHEQTGQAIETLFHDRLAEHYDELAHHTLQLQRQNR